MQCKSYNCCCHCPPLEVLSSLGVHQSLLGSQKYSIGSFRTFRVHRDMQPRNRTVHVCCSAFLNQILTGQTILTYRNQCGICQQVKLIITHRLAEDNTLSIFFRRQVTTMAMTAVDVTPGTTTVWKQSQFSSRNIRTATRRCYIDNCFSSQ